MKLDAERLTLYNFEVLTPSVRYFEEREIKVFSGNFANRLVGPFGLLTWLNC